MPNDVVLLIHGMGQHRAADEAVSGNNESDPNITEDFVSGMSEGAKYLGLNNYQIGEHVDLIEFNYSSFLDSIRTQLSKSLDEGTDTEAIADLLKRKGNGLSIAQKLIDFHQGLADDKMLNTHWLDVFIYGSTYWGEKIRIDLASKLNELSDVMNREVHIVSHSLGTAVVHDTLYKIHTPGNDRAHRGMRMPRIGSLITLANVSRILNILNGVGEPTTDVVSTGKEGCLIEFLNVRNKYDPFTWYKTFNARQPPRAVNIAVDYVRRQNTHDFKEYVTVPEVCEEIIRLVDYETYEIIDPTKRDMKAYKSTTLNQKISELRQILKKLRSLPSVGDLDKPDIIRTITGYKKAFADISTAYKEIETWIDANWS